MLKGTKMDGKGMTIQYNPIQDQDKYNVKKGNWRSALIVFGKNWGKSREVES